MAHQEQSEHHENLEPGGLNSAVIAVVGVVGIMLVIVIFLAVEAWLAGYQEAQIGALRYDQPNAELRDYQREQHRKLNEPRWVDQENGVAAVPIGRAMEIYVERRVQSGGE